MTHWFDHSGIGSHWREDGNPDGPAVLFLNSLGTDLRLWDHVVDRIITNLGVLDVVPGGLKIVECADGVTVDELRAATEATIV